MRAEGLARSRARMRVVGALMVAAVLGLGARASYLALFEERASARAVAQTSTQLSIAPARGTVFDRHGTELAVSVDAPSVYAHPPRVTRPRATARRLARILGRPASDLEERLRGAREFVFLARWIDADAAERIESEDFPGIGITWEPMRRYPLGDLAAQALGFANIDGAGVRGVERLEDHWLRGKRQLIEIERDARRRALVPGRVDPTRAMGGDLALTIDAAAQSDVERALDDAVDATGARGGIALLLDPGVGDILAVAERPTFDPNDFRSVPFSQTRARSWSDALEPGSTMKPFVVAAALESGVISADEPVDCEGGRMRIPGKTLTDTKPHGVLSIGEVLRYSSNIGAAKIGFALGPERHHRMLRAFGFGSPTGSGLPGESAGLLRDWRAWRPVDHATISFGHGVGVTALQLAAATGAIANGGVWREPRLVAARRRSGSDWRTEPLGSARQSVGTKTAERVFEMLESAVAPGGTGARATIPGARVAGKTGTAQKLDPATGGYSQNRYLAWFAGAVKLGDELFVGVVMLDEPAGKAHTGGAVAAPLFARIASGELMRRGFALTPPRDGGVSLARRRP